MVATATSHPVGARHPFTSSVIAAFVATKPGEVLTDAQISKACGAPRSRWCGLMPTVRRALLKEHGIAIRRSRSVGYQHLVDLDVPATADSAIAHIRRTARKAANTLVYGVKNYSALPPRAQVELNTRIAQTSTLHFLSTHTTERAIRSAVEVSNSKLEIGNTLSLLAGRDH